IGHGNSYTAAVSDCRQSLGPQQGDGGFSLLIRAANSNSVVYDAAVGTPVLPNFFIVGTGKAGTTSLYHYLRQHPRIYMSPVKEPCYFASEICAENLTDTHLRHIRQMSQRNADRLPSADSVGPFRWLVKEWDDYLELFQDVRSQSAIGEASVAYLWSETAA